MRLRGSSGFVSIARMVALVAVVGVTGGMTVAVAGTARAAAGSGSGAGPGSVYVVGAGAQAAARAFWTPGRMAAVVSASQRQEPLGPLNAEGLEPASSLVEQKPPRDTPSPVTFGGVPTIGTLFYSTSSGGHFCTASVVSSKTGNMVMTAAHCVYSGGYATNLEFAPGYDSGSAPYGDWSVKEITVAKGWREHQDPDLDYAFLEVAPPPLSAGPIQSVTGAMTIGFSRRDAESITVIGYNDTSQQPIRCATKSFKFSSSQMEFYCRGFWYGTSGGPWIIDYDGSTGTGTVFGLIGGYEAGGYQSWASYSTILWQNAESLFKQAEAAA
jgi:V8-like Glu-specific endopeptidase